MDIAQQAAAMSGYKQQVVNGKTYTIKLLPAAQALDIFYNKLMIAAAPILANALDDASTDELLIDDENIFTNKAMLFARYGREVGIVDTVQTLLQGASCNSQAINFDTHFAGNFGEMIAVAEFALKENFGDFFTSYLKAKGLTIPTLSQVLGKRDNTLEESND